MKLTTWNIRGLNVPSKKHLLKCNLSLFESDIILIQEMKLNKEEEKKIRRKLGFWKIELVESVEAFGGWVFCGIL